MSGQRAQASWAALGILTRRKALAKRRSSTGSGGRRGRLSVFHVRQRRAQHFVLREFRPRCEVPEAVARPAGRRRDACGLRWDVSARGIAGERGKAELDDA